MTDPVVFGQAVGVAMAGADIVDPFKD